MQPGKPVLDLLTQAGWKAELTFVVVYILIYVKKTVQFIYSVRVISWL